VIAADEPDHGLAARAFAGARRAVIPAFGVGAIVGLVTGVPVLLCAGAGAIAGITIGAAVAIVGHGQRPRGGVT